MKRLEGKSGESSVGLAEIVQPNKKIVGAWAVEGDFDPKTLKSNLFEVEWPPRSGKTPIVSRGRLCGIVRTAGGARENPGLDSSRSSTAWSLPLSPLEYCF